MTLRLLNFSRLSKEKYEGGMLRYCFLSKIMVYDKIIIGAGIYGLYSALKSGKWGGAHSGT